MTDTAAAPELIILAGPNGGGKSSFQALFAFPGVFVNADLNARILNPREPEQASLRAGKIALRQIDDLLTRRESFTYETTLSSESALKVISVAKERGYRILLVFIALATVELHILRVRQRVQLGGHDIPENVIRRRYNRCFYNLARAMPLCDAVLLYDNGGEEPVKKLELAAQRIVFSALRLAYPLDRHFVECVSLALGLDPAEITPGR